MGPGGSLISQDLYHFILKNFTFHCSGRKRRGSETLSESSGDDECNSGVWSTTSDERSQTPVMSECTAAMVLMNLSFCPRDGGTLKNQPQTSVATSAGTKNIQLNYLHH